LRADKAEWAGAYAIGLSARGAKPSHEASAEPEKGGSKDIGT